MDDQAGFHLVTHGTYLLQEEDKVGAKLLGAYALVTVQRPHKKTGVAAGHSGQK